jgi:hypothetical protein
MITSFIIRDKPAFGAAAPIGRRIEFELNLDFLRLFIRAEISED